MSIAERIKESRGEMSQADFATKLGVHKNSLGRYERGVSTPDSEFIILLCSVCNLSPYWLLFGEGPRSQDSSHKKIELQQKYSRLASRNTQLKNELLARVHMSIELSKLLPKILDPNQPNVVLQVEKYFREMTAIPDFVLKVDVIEADPDLVEIDDSSLPDLI